MTLIDDIKSAIPIEDEIGRSYTVTRSGRILSTEEHDSLKIWPENRSWFWFSRDQGGDLFDWVQMREGCSFAKAVEILAERAGLPVEPPTAQQKEARRTRRNRQEVLHLAASWLQEQFWSSHDARTYAFGRGWDEQTCRREKLGYMPPAGEAAEGTTLAEILRRADLLDNPTARAVLSIPGGMLVYVHRVRGEVVSFSARHIRERRHYRLPAGEETRTGLYHNRPHDPREGYTLLVEGPADAISVGQLRFHGVALGGARLNEEERSRLPAITHVALDNDETGQTRALEIALTLSPLVRVVEWRLHDRPQKDANAFLLALGGGGELTDLLNRAPRAIDLLAQAVEEASSDQREPALRRLLDAYATLDDLTAADLKPKLARCVGGIAQFNRLLRAHQQQQADEKGPSEEIVYSAGGAQAGLLWEQCVVWSEEGEGHTLFAVRSPGRSVEMRAQVEVGGVVYRPYPPRMGLITKGVVLFPERPEPYQCQRTLLRDVQRFIHRYLDIDPFYERLAAYYVLFTWLYDLFETLPYLRVLGDHGTGKSRFLQSVGALCYRPMFISGASTTSPIFRIIDMFRGTLIVDEADFAHSDVDAEIIKILNVGYYAGGVVLRAEKEMNAGVENYWPAAKDVYGPKLLATRRLFADRATESRCLTRRMIARSPRPGIPYVLDRTFWQAATRLRNRLLSYRLAHHGDITIDPELADHSLEPRLNQVTMALKATVDDPAMLSEIDAYISAYNKSLIEDRRMTLPAVIVQTLADIYYSGSSNLYGDARDFSMKGIYRVARALLNDIDPDERLSPRRVGSILSEQLGLNRRGEHPRTRRAVVRFDEEELIALMKRYGIRKSEREEKPEVV